IEGGEWGKLRALEGGAMQKLGWFAARVVLCAELAALTSGDAARAQSATQSGAVTVIRAGTLIDGVSETPRKNQLIFVRGERIVKVTGSGEAIPSGANLIDLSSSTVLPGLTDSHTHIFLWGEYPEGRECAARGARHVCRAEGARAGVYGVARPRDLGRGLRRRRNQAGHRRGDDSRPAAVLRDARDFHDRRVQPGRLCARAGHAQGRATRRGAGGGAH